MHSSNYLEKTNTYQPVFRHDSLTSASKAVFNSQQGYPHPGATTQDWSTKKSLTDMEMLSSTNAYATSGRESALFANGNPGQVNYSSHSPAHASPLPMRGLSQSKMSNSGIREPQTLSGMKDSAKDFRHEREPAVVTMDRDHVGQLYSRCGLMLLEMNRLHWKLSNLQNRNETLERDNEQLRQELQSLRVHSPRSTGSPTLILGEDKSASGAPISEGVSVVGGNSTAGVQHQEAVSRQAYDDLEEKFNSLLNKYGEGREEIQKKHLMITKLETDLKTRELEIAHLKSENEQVSTSLYVEKSNVFAKYKQMEESNSKLEAKIYSLEAEIDSLRDVKAELVRTAALFADKNELADKLKTEIQICVDDVNVCRGLVLAREKEIEKLNQKNAELIKIAQEYTHIKQLLEIARKDVDTYKEAYESREKMISKLSAELSRIEVLNQVIQEKTSRIAFLEDEIKRLKEKLDEKDTQIEILRSRNIDQDLEKFRNNELSSQVNQLKAKVEFVEKKLALREEENEQLQKKLIEATGKIEELKTYEIKLEQVCSEREDLLHQIYGLKKELLELAKLEKEIEKLHAANNEKQILIDKLKEKVESLKVEIKDLKGKLEEQKTEIFELQLSMKEGEDIKHQLEEARDSLKDAREHNEALANNIQELQASNADLDGQLAKLRGELRESSEKNRTKMNLLIQENANMDDKLKKMQELEKKLEKSLATNAEFKLANDNLVNKNEIFQKELKGLEGQLQRQKEANTELENRVNILKEVESKNKELARNLDALNKDLTEAVAQQKKVASEGMKAREELAQSIRESDLLRSEVQKRDEKLQDGQKAIENLQNEAQSLIGQLETEKKELGEKLQQEYEKGEDWEKRYKDLQAQFDKYYKEYEHMSMKYERMSAVNDDHVKDIENKAFAIAQLHRKILVMMIELTRLDFVRNNPPQ